MLIKHTKVQSRDKSPELIRKDDSIWEKKIHFVCSITSLRFAFNDTLCRMTHPALFFYYFICLTNGKIHIFICVVWVQGQQNSINNEYA